MLVLRSLSYDQCRICKIFARGLHLPLPFPTSHSSRPSPSFPSLPVADPKILKGAHDNLSAPSSFIANAHNKIYAFYTEKSGFLKQNMSQ